MNQEQLESLSEAEQEEIRRAFKMGVRACVFMAREIETLFSNLSVMETLGAKHLMPILEFSVDPVMQGIGDCLNGQDTVDDEAQQATDGAFKAVAEVLKKYGHPRS